MKKQTLPHAGLRSLIKTARALGALRVKIGDIEIELDPRFLGTPTKASATKALLSNVTPPSSDELLYHSAPDFFEQDK